MSVSAGCLVDHTLFTLYGLPMERVQQGNCIQSKLLKYTAEGIDEVFGIGE